MHERHEETVPSHVLQFDVHLSHFVPSSFTIVPSGQISVHSCLSASKNEFGLHDVHFVGSSVHPRHVSAHQSHSPLASLPNNPVPQSDTHLSPFKKKPLTHFLHVSTLPTQSEQGD